MSTAATAAPASPNAPAPPCSEQQKTATGTTTTESSSLKDVAAATTTAAAAEEETTKPKLPPLTPAEFRIYNHMAEHMELFHNHFRATWNLLWTACTTGRRPAGMSLKAFVNEGLQFLRHLEVHHNIEETHIFPVLARKMPEFKAGKGNGAAELLRQHRQIHKGMDGLEEYLRDVQAGRQEFDLGRLKERMEGWAEVLWTHLDQEVKTLGAENMRLYWSESEMRRMPM
ncbi:hypothetical protein BKA67DRAFT_535269 [Truncatella angustata]|uniref:Hemerythrin-like domain-containing protein n=1 Tax=Truncatella angustata TaxID=152316 RepID=A0A9P8UKM3_9PEZI|nr:uncharacterized protein BKA67DRAFT_535269 [Truncatella angustata]KAH6653923.1 hypothetical protein BKA67DRAFT_535269 [Truncatella angustata]KAH8198042.1 hypothetical protein TruAng_007817 [Truncatella angustata]